MFGLRLGIDNPEYLLLLLALPLLVWFSFRSLSGLGRVRRWVAILGRAAVVTALVLALAEVKIVRKSERLTVIYLLDQSVSIPPEQRVAMINYVNAEIAKHRQEQDRAAVIVFGGDAAIEHPPYDENITVPTNIESRIDTEHTDLAGAMKLAQASFPEDSARRVVLVTDGNENLGDGLEQARALAQQGTGIDVVPVLYSARPEVAVEKVSIPPDVTRGQPFNLGVVLNNLAPPDSKAPPVKGKLTVVRKAGSEERILDTQNVELGPGKKVFNLREKLDAANFYVYEAKFVADDPRTDTLTQNNLASASTHVRGKGQVLLIVSRPDGLAAGGPAPDEPPLDDFQFLVDRLRHENLEVTVQTTDQLFATLAELQPFDTVLLGDVPRERFTDQQIEMLVRNTQQMGAGLVMLGGPNSFGAGGWNNTLIEEAMPVDFSIKDDKVVPVGALAMLMHASEIAEGNYWQKQIAKEALNSLGNRDYCGVMHFEGTMAWLWKPGMLRVGSARTTMLSRVDRMAPGDMPDFEPALNLALNGFSTLTDAAIKHMIVISDGDPARPASSTLAQFKQLGIKISTVAVAAHGAAESATMQYIANYTGGKFYVVNNPKALPKIYQAEARRVAKPLVYERKEGFQPQVQFPHEMLRGIEGTLPPITGFVLTQQKQNPLVEVGLVSPLPAGQSNNTILASWTYGLGKTAVLTTDAGTRWAGNWKQWSNYDKLFSQMTRWSMRPVGEQGKFTVSTEVRDGRVQIVLTALDKDDDFLNFLNFAGNVISPNMKPLDVKITQTAPGRYVGQFDAKEAGSYFLMLSPGPTQSPILTSINVPYSAEYMDRNANEPLLRNIAGLTPRDSAPGAIIGEGTDRQLKSLLATDTFRHNLAPATSSQDIWPLLLVLGSCLFFTDIFNRRVMLGLGWFWSAVEFVETKLLRTDAVPVRDEVMERLRGRKTEVTDAIAQRQAANRFEAPPGETSAEPPSMTAPPTSTPTPKPTQPSAPAKPEEPTYTERLLEAKKKAIRDKDKPEQG